MIPPDLIVEVISPRENAEGLARKLNDYRDAGVPIVWVIYPLGACLFSAESRCGSPVYAGWMLRRAESQLVRPGAQLFGSWGRGEVW